MVINLKAALKSISASAEFKPNVGKMTAAQRLALNMDNAFTAFKAGNVDEDGQPLKRPTIVQKGKEVKFSLRYSNVPLKLPNDEEEAVVPAESFAEIYEALNASVLKGDFNAQLAPLEAKTKARGTKMAASRAAKKADAEKK